MSVDRKQPKGYWKAWNGELAARQEPLATAPRLTVVEWARERLANTIRLAAQKNGDDRAGWLEDARYWAKIVRALELFGVNCEVCERRTHAKWHEYSRNEMNPIALVEFIEALPDKGAQGMKQAILGYIFAITAMDVEKMRAALAEQYQAEKSHD